MRRIAPRISEAFAGSMSHLPSPLSVIPWPTSKSRWHGIVWMGHPDTSTRFRSSSLSQGITRNDRVCVCLVAVVIGLGACLSAMADAPPAPGAAASVWVVDDSVRLDPVTGALIEERHGSGAVGPSYRSQNPVWNGTSISLMAARNEVVAFQVIVSGGPHTGVALTVSDLTGPATLSSSDTVRRFKEWFFQVTSESEFCSFSGERYVHSLGLGWYPDPLIPLDEPGPPSAGYGQPFAIPDPRNAVPGQTAAAFWVDLLVPAETPAGRYAGTVSVALDGGTVSLPLALDVRPLTLPAYNHAGLGSVNYGGLSFNVLWANAPTPNTAGLTRWFQMAHAHRLELDAHWIWPLGKDGTLGSPCDPDWTMWRDIWRPYVTGAAFTAAQGYWGPSAGQPVRRFTLPQDWAWPTGDQNGDDRPDNEATWQKSLRDAESAIVAEGWTGVEAQLWFRPTDEPRTVHQFDLIKYYGGLVNGAGLADRRHITHRVDLGFFKNIGEVINGWTTDRIFSEIGSDVEVWNIVGSIFSAGASPMQARIAAHPEEQWWFYISCCAGEPAVGAPYIEGEALGMRSWGWTAYRYGMQGGVTWEMDAGYTNLPACWTDPKCAGWGINGDAVLFYSGWTIGLPDYQPVASIRLKNLRRGSQDYEYLWLLQAQDGNRDRAAALAAEVVPQALDDGLEPFVAEPPGRWAHTPQAYESARRQAADWLASTACTLSCTAAASAPSGGTVTFTATAVAQNCAGTPSYAWEFGDGSGGTGASATHSYASAGTFSWTLTVTADGQTCARTGSVTISSPATPPAVTAMAKLGSPFRINVTGSNLQSGIQVFINGSPWTNLKWKSATSVLLKGGGALKAAVPRGIATQFRFVNPDGGETTYTWSW